MLEKETFSKVVLRKKCFCKVPPMVSSLNVLFAEVLALNERPSAVIKSDNHNVQEQNLKVKQMNGSKISSFLCSYIFYSEQVTGSRFTIQVNRLPAIQFKYSLFIYFDTKKVTGSRFTISHKISKRWLVILCTGMHTIEPTMVSKFTELY